MNDRTGKETTHAPATVEVDSGEGAAVPAGAIQTLRRGMQILEMVISSGSPVRISEVARRFDMDRASAFRFLQTLDYDGFLSKNAKNKSYSVGGRLLHWSVQMSSDLGITKMARPYLEQLVRETEESGHIGILSNSQALLLDYIGSKGTIVVQNRVGVLEPLYSTALGKALLAFQPPDRQKELLERISFSRFTERTINSRTKLESALETIRREAVAHDNAEYNELLYCIASPVIGIGGMALGAIGVSLVHPIAIKSPEKIASVSNSVRTVARKLSAAAANEEAAASVFGPVFRPESDQFPSS